MGSLTARKNEVHDAFEGIQTYIHRHEMVPGDALPPERAFIEELATTRNTYREAIKLLQACGIVEVKHGHGTFVGDLAFDGLRAELAFQVRLRDSGRDRLIDVLEVREALELGLITSLAIRRLEPDTGQLSALMAQMDREAGHGSLSLATDRAFHHALYEPLGNPVATLLLEVLWDVAAEYIKPITSRAEAMETADRHHALLTAIQAGDPRAARVAMQNHFTGLRNRMGMPISSEGPDG